MEGVWFFPILDIKFIGLVPVTQSLTDANIFCFAYIAPKLYFH